MARLLSFEPIDKSPTLNFLKKKLRFFQALDVFTKLMVIAFASIILSTPFIVANTQIFNPKAVEIPIQILSRVEINPASLAPAVGASPIGLSALAYDTNNNPIWSGVSYSWGISSSNSIGIVSPTSGPITNFRPINAGSGDLFVNATFLDKTFVKSMLVTVGSVLTPTLTISPSPTPTLTLTPTPTGIVTSTPTPSPIAPSFTPTPTPIPPVACALTSASWVTRSNPVVEGDRVRLNVRTNNDPSCIGKKVELQVWESDSLLEGGIDDKADIMPRTITISGNTATSSWIAEWQNDCRGLCNPPEYYFKAKITGGSKIIRSGPQMLIVNQR